MSWYSTLQTHQSAQTYFEDKFLSFHFHLFSHLHAREMEIILVYYVISQLFLLQFSFSENMGLKSALSLAYI